MQRTIRVISLSIVLMPVHVAHSMQQQSPALVALKDYMQPFLNRLNNPRYQDIYIERGLLTRFEKIINGLEQHNRQAAQMYIDRYALRDLEIIKTIMDQAIQKKETELERLQKKSLLHSCLTYAPHTFNEGAIMTTAVLCLALNMSVWIDLLECLWNSI